MMRPFASASGDALRPRLLYALKDRRLQPFALILTGLTGAPGDAARIVPFLRDPNVDWVVREKAVYALRDLGATSARTDVFASVSGSGDMDWVAVAVGDWFERCGIGKCGTAFRRYLQSATLRDWVKANLLVRLALREPASTLPLLGGFLATVHSHDLMMSSSIYRLAECDDPRVDPILREAIRSRDSTLVLSAAAALAQRGVSDVSPILQGFVDAPEAARAIRALGMLQGPGVRQCLLRVLTKSPPPDPQVVAATFWSLRCYDDAEVREVLVRALEGESPETRQAAEDALVWQGTPVARAALRRTARGANPVAAVYAAEGLQRLDETVEPREFLSALSRKEVSLDYEAYGTAIDGLRAAWLKSPLDAPLACVAHPLHAVRLAALLSLLEHPEAARIGRGGAPKGGQAASASGRFWIRYRWAAQIAARAESLRVSAGRALDTGDAIGAAGLLDLSDRILGVWENSYPAAGLSAVLTDVALRTEPSDSAWVDVDLRLGDMKDLQARLRHLIEWRPALRAYAAQDPRF